MILSLLSTSLLMNTVESSILSQYSSSYLRLLSIDCIRQSYMNSVPN